MKRVFGALTAAAFALVVTPAWAQTINLSGLADVVAQKADTTSKKDQPVDKKQVAEKVTEKQKEIKELSDRAAVVQTKMSAILASGDPTQSKEALDALRQMVEELTGINKRLGELASDIQEIKGLLKTENDSIPAMKSDISTLKNFKPSIYIQFQYRDANNTDAGGNFAGQRGFQVRRAQAGFNYKIDAKNSVKFLMDASQGSDQRSFELKDAALIRELSPAGKNPASLFTAGQFATPLGYELLRSSSEREFPEYFTANRRYFGGARTRGAYASFGVGQGASVYGGLISPLTVSDAEQTGKPTVNEVGGIVGARHTTKKTDFGVGYFAGRRPMVGTDPTKSVSADRRFFYLDGSLIDFIPGMTARFEVISGHDRLPSATAKLDDGTPLTAYQLLLSYRLNPSNLLFTRYGMTDPDTSSDGNAISEFGFGWRYYLAPTAFVTLSWEQFNDPALFNDRYHVTTLRYTFKF